MGIVIDRTDSSCNYIAAFDKSFIDFINNYLSDVTFTDTTKRLSVGVQSAQTGDWVILPNIDWFNSLSVTRDFDIIVSTELLKTYDSNNQRTVFYSINIDYQPLRTSQYAMQYMNVLLNLFEGLNSDYTGTKVWFGMQYTLWDYFQVTDPLSCVLWTTPTAQKVDQDRANYLRWSIDFIFMLMINPEVEVCGA